jgi:hypothetical protein
MRMMDRLSRFRDLDMGGMVLRVRLMVVRIQSRGLVRRWLMGVLFRIILIRRRVGMGFLLMLMLLLNGKRGRLMARDGNIDIDIGDGMMRRGREINIVIGGGKMNSRGREVGVLV